MFLKTLTFFGFLSGMMAASAAPPLPPAVTIPAIPESGSLRVTVKLSKPQVRSGQFCPMEMDVVNISSRLQTFRTFGCSWGGGAMEHFGQAFIFPGRVAAMLLEPIARHHTQAR